MDHRRLSADRARALLRKLRDLNLFSGPVAITNDLHVVLAGCLSLDGPAENGVRYRVRHSDGTEAWLEIVLQQGALQLSASALESVSGPLSMSVELSCDRQGRALARELSARVRPESIDRRELEHFLRRIVRTLFRR